MPRAVSPQRRVESTKQHSLNEGQSQHKGRLKVIGKEYPDIETDEQFQANWKISKAREEVLLVEYHNQLTTAGLLRPDHDKYYLRRFLRARQHDVARAKQMYSDHVRWRKEYEVDNIANKFEFHERDVFLTLYPQGYHKTDKLGRPIYIQHLGAINIKKLNEITNEERMLKFHVQEYERCINYIMPACSKVSGRHIDQTFAIIDVTGVSLSHFSGQVKNLLSRITSVDQNNYPEMMGKTLIINAPGMFKMVWGMVKRFLDARTLTKIELLGSNYQSTLLKYVDKENLPEYLGGASKATLLDDAGPWQDEALITEIDAERAAALNEGLSMEADATGPSANRAAGETSTAAASGAAEEPLLKAPLPKRRLSIRGFKRQAVTSPTLPNGDVVDDQEAYHDSLELQARSNSSASEDDAAYYSPRSTSSFSSFTDRGQPGNDNGSHPLLEALNPSKGAAQAKQITLAARLRRLEDAIPELREKLAPHLDLKRIENGSFTRGGGHNVLGRVEALEDAVEVLLTVQEEKLQPEKPALKDSHEREPEKIKHCGCCTVM